MKRLYKTSILLLLLLLPMVANASHAEEDVVLMIHNECASENILDAFMREHPSIRVEEHEDPHNCNATIEEALTRSSEVDVYFMYTLTSTTYEALRDRGYFLELTDADVLAMADSIYPELRAAATYDGSLCALPFGIQGQPIYAVNMDVWSALGLSDDELPRTWAELLRFAVERWPAIAENHEEVQLLGESEIDTADLLGRIESNYEAYRAIHNYDMGYNTPEFREVLDLFAQLCNMDVFSAAEDASASLFDSFYVPAIFGTGADHTRSLHLSFAENDRACYPVGLKVMAINPNSEHVEEALELIKYVFSNTELERRMEICPNMNEPVINENYLSAQEQYPVAMAAYERRIQSAADEADRRELELEREAYAQDMQNYFAEYKYIASPERIRKYRDDVRGAMVPIYKSALSSDDYGAVNDCRAAFLRGELPADTYIRELERRFVFSVLENRFYNKSRGKGRKKETKRIRTGIMKVLESKARRDHFVSGELYIRFARIGRG